MGKKDEMAEVCDECSPALDMKVEFEALGVDYFALQLCDACMRSYVTDMALRDKGLWETFKITASVVLAAMFFNIDIHGENARCYRDEQGARFDALREEYLLELEWVDRLALEGDFLLSDEYRISAAELGKYPQHSRPP